MNRFIKFRLVKGVGSLEAILRNADSYLVNHDKEEGFEVKELTPKALHLVWIEKISITRKLEDDVFGEFSYQEVKVIRFDLIFPQDMKSVILINPPSARHKFRRVLKLLVDGTHCALQTLDVFESIKKLKSLPEWRLVALQTDQANMGNGMFVSVGVSGVGDLSGYLETLKMGGRFVLKSAWFDHALRTGLARVMISKSGLVRSSKDLTASEIISISGRVVYEG